MSPQCTIPSVCAAPGCSKPTHGNKKLCPMHGWRLRHHGSFDIPECHPSKGVYSVHPIVDEVTGCHNWPGAMDGNGYGNLNRNGRVTKAYRWYWIQRHGEIPKGLQLDHICRNRRCCNPDHLELVTPAENTRRGMAPNIIAHRENRCRRGHDFTPENSIHRADGTRTCRTCENAAQMRRYTQRKAVQA